MRFQTFFYYGYISRNPSQVLLVDANGRQDEVSCFKAWDDTSFYQSCSLTWHGEFYVFGGYSGHVDTADSSDQISRVVGTELVNFGSLDFTFYHLTCDVMGLDTIFLCSDQFSFASNTKVAVDN